MANRAFVEGRGYLDKGIKRILLTINTGTAGAVSSFTGTGVKSVTRNSAGNYTIVFQDVYYSFKQADIAVRGTASTGTPTAAKAATGVPFNFRSNNTIDIQMLSNVTAADVTDNWFIDCEFIFKDSVI